MDILKDIALGKQGYVVKMHFFINSIDLEKSLMNITFYLYKFEVTSHVIYI